jgi:hypothetical protein
VKFDGNQTLKKMKKKSNILKVAVFISMTWGGLSCTTNQSYSPTGSFWQFNLKQIDKGY